MKTRIFISIFVFLSLMVVNSCVSNSDVTYNVNIDFGNDFPKETYIVKKGEKLPEEVAKTTESQYVSYFLNENNNTKIDFDTPIVENCDLSAVWEFNKYTVNFYDDSNNLIYSYLAEHGSALVYPEEPFKEGGDHYSYKFSKWSISPTTVTKELNITAKFIKVWDEMTVTLLDVEGNVMAIEYCDYNGWINTYKEPEFEKDNNKYYRFLGWYDKNTDEEFDFNDKVVKSCILEPRYDIYDIEETTLDNAIMSIMGDSISTFYDGSNNPQSYYGGTNQYYYPIYSATVKSYTQTWWYQTYNSLGLKLGVNNSWSGSSAFGHSSSAGSSTSRLETLGENGTPNIVVIYLGTNDNVNGHTVENLRKSYETMIEYITTNYVTFEGTTAKIPYIYLFTSGYSAYSGYNYTEQRRLEFNALFRELANEYQNVRLFDLANFITKDNYSLYLGDSLHYNATGMTFIATNFVKQLKEDFNIN